MTERGCFPAMGKEQADGTVSIRQNTSYGLFLRAGYKGGTRMLLLAGLAYDVEFAVTELYRLLGILLPLGPALFPSLLLVRQSHT